MSILEISHRSQAFGEILEEAKANLGKLLRIPDGYQVLFLQGGGRLQFSMIALSFGSRDAAAQYIVTGTCS
jgi:phosphoserine aminotransferase